MKESSACTSSSLSKNFASVSSSGMPDYFHVGDEENSRRVCGRVSRGVVFCSLRGVVPCHRFAECPSGFQPALPFIGPPLPISFGK